MIEIIGVLAVIGVLSIAVLYLYPYLVAHHRSNETWNDVLVQATVVQTSHTDDTFAAIEIVDGEELPSLITSEEFKTSAVGYPMEVYKTNDVQFIVQVDNVDYDACEIMLKKHSLVPDAIEVGNSKFEPIQENYDICGTSGTKTMYFYFGFCNGDINAVCDGGCGANFECFCGRCWCPTVGADPQTCQCPENYDTIDGECVCPEDRQLPEGVCCPKGEHADNGICCPKDEYNSKGICCLDDLLNGSHLWIAQEFWNDDGEEELKCVCQRTCDNNDLIPNADCTACVCAKTCDNGFVLNETNCTCECPEDRQLPDGKCCPVGRHADDDLCCLEGDYNSNGVCCSAELFDDEQTNRWIGQNGECVCNQEYLNCQNDLVHNAECTACVCAKTCENGFVLNKTNCTCECPTGDLTTDGECCPDGRHADGERCCEDGDYNSNGVCCLADLFDDRQTNRWIEQNGECVCNKEYLNCQNDLVPNDECTACVCAKTCENGFVLNEANCTCECPKDKPYSYNEQCNVCPEDQTYASESQKCCPNDQYNSIKKTCCPVGRKVDKNGVCCATSQLNSQTNTCCPTGQTYATASKMCCPVGQKVDKNGVCCSTSQLNSKTNTCCPKGKIYKSKLSSGACCLPEEKFYYEGNFRGCCLPSKWASSQRKCCDENEVASNGYCCLKGTEYYKDINFSSDNYYVKELFRFYSDQIPYIHCCPPEKYTEYKNRSYCCSSSQTVSNNHCCPIGESWAEEKKKCCPNERYGVNKNGVGVCCAKGEVFAENSNSCCPVAHYVAETKSCCASVSDRCYKIKDGTCCRLHTKACSNVATGFKNWCR